MRSVDGATRSGEDTADDQKADGVAVRPGRENGETKMMTITEEMFATPKISIQTPSTTYLALLDKECPKSYVDKQ
ncbi:hypothetical protein PR048_018693 [Dryococelus australis]|uniref:Uncharacterized protein n=1 Tax=Dryococelus australis TaxID=614101 RepID=A0ABQ9HD88_9NEOP|nr:hypothetical protein PR048_018693 [Dryococelus australis]